MAGASDRECCEMVLVAGGVRLLQGVEEGTSLRGTLGVLEEAHGRQVLSRGPRKAQGDSLQPGLLPSRAGTSFTGLQEGCPQGILELVWLPKAKELLTTVWETWFVPI